MGIVRMIPTHTPFSISHTAGTGDLNRLIGIDSGKSLSDQGADVLDCRLLPRITAIDVCELLLKLLNDARPLRVHGADYSEHARAELAIFQMARDMRERFGHDVFLRMHTDTLRASLTRDIDIVAVTDVRKKPDAALVRRLGGYVVKITRKVADAVPVDDETEEPLPDEWIDFVLENNGTLTEFREKLEALVQPLIEAPGYTAEQMHAIDMLTMHLLEHGFAQDIRDYPPAQKAAFKTMLERAQPGLSKLLTTHIDAPGEDREGAGEHLVQPGDAGGAPSDAGAAGGETS